MINTIGLVGRGFIGRTLENVFRKLATKRKLDLRIHDKNSNISLNTLEEVAQCEVVFVGVPTPMIKETGECYTGFVEQAIIDLRDLNKNNFIVIKSTVPPGTCKKWDIEYNNIFFNPEFLTEKSPDLDFAELDYQILGLRTFGAEQLLGYDGDDFKNIWALEDLFLELGDEGITRCKTVYFCSHSEAEMIKYTRNCYLAVRLSYFNEIKQVCDKFNIDYFHMKNLAGLDKRVGSHYNNIKYNNPGYSGHCLPKDLSAFSSLAESVDIEPNVCWGAKNTNDKICKNRDWEKMDGRAVISLKDIKK